MIVKIVKIFLSEIRDFQSDLYNFTFIQNKNYDYR